MNCKNCNTPQRTDYKFCPACGAKVVVKRLTFRNLVYDITERVFNVDSTFFRTFIQLFNRPEQVIDSYIQGVRRRYLNPISHLGIALTLSGLTIFVMKKVMTPEMFNAYGGDLPEEVAGKIYEAVFDYSSLFFLVYIPVFALAGYLTFNKKNYFFSEYVIAFIYIMAQWSIAVFLPTILILLFAPETYMTVSFPFLFVMIAYSIFAIQRIHRFSPGAVVLRSMVFLMLITIGYFGIIFLFYALMFLSGTLNIQDFAPKP
jgi:hypothetical protein